MDTLFVFATALNADPTPETSFEPPAELKMLPESFLAPNARVAGEDPKPKLVVVETTGVGLMMVELTEARKGVGAEFEVRAVGLTSSVDAKAGDGSDILGARESGAGTDLPTALLQAVLAATGGNSRACLTGVGEIGSYRGGGGCLAGGTEASSVWWRRASNSVLVGAATAARSTGLMRVSGREWRARRTASLTSGLQCFTGETT